jgi:lipopolysaccharide/colanic/teichoic acid biosynthesis glycosyltransferase
MGGMSSLSFDNVFPPDPADRTDGVSSHPAVSHNRTSAPRSDAARPIARPTAAAQASRWALSTLRRALDITVAVIALLVFAPLMLFAAILVRRGSLGPVLFRQGRMGRNGRQFTLYKFRSMSPVKGNNSCITVSGDLRITPVGSFLRRYKLDELPQFWNVLRGDMSLVGPRPKLPHHEALLLPCRPGITGVATLAFRREEEFLSEIPEDQLETFYETFVKPAKAQLDLDYMRTATFGSDLKVLWRTASACLFSADDAVTESAETIIQYETEARKHAVTLAIPLSQIITRPRIHPAAGLNPEI